MITYQTYLKIRQMQANYPLLLLTMNEQVIWTKVDNSKRLARLDYKEFKYQKLLVINNLEGVFYMYNLGDFVILFWIGKVFYYSNSS